MPTRTVAELVAELEAKLAAKFEQQIALTELQQEIDRLMAVLLTYPSVQLPLSPLLSNIALNNLSVDPNAVHNEIVGLLNATGGDGTWLWAIIGGGGEFELSSTAGVATILERSATGTLTPGGTLSVQISCISGGVTVVRTFIINIDTLPTDISLSASSIVDAAASGTIVGVLSTTGGKTPHTYAVTVNSKFTISGTNLVRSSSGVLTAGVPENVTVRDTDTNGNQFNEVFPITVSSAATGVLVTSFDVDNWSGSSSPGFIRFGLLFKQGDIPTGRVPEIRLSGTPLVGQQFDERTTWPDGSLKVCIAKIRDTTFTGSESRTYTVWSTTGTYNNTGAKSLSDIPHDFNVVFSALTQYTATGNGAWGSGAARDSGTKTASFATQKAVATRCWKYEIGPVSESWEVWGPAIDSVSGLPDAHLVTVWYVTIWKNAAGAIVDYEYACVPSQFWWSIAGKCRLDYNATLKNGAGTIQAYNTVKHPYRSQWATVRMTDDNNYARDHWVTAIPTLAYKPDKDYWVETGLIPCLDTEFQTTVSSTATYVPCGNISHRAFEDGTGSYLGRGLLPNDAARAFMTQSVLDVRYARANALVALHALKHYRSNRTRQRPASAGCPGGDATPDIAASIISLILLKPLDSNGPASIPADYDFTADGMPIAVDAYAASTDSAYKDGYVSTTGGAGVWNASTNDSHAVDHGYYMYLLEGRRYLMQATIDHSVNSATILTSSSTAGRPTGPPFYANATYQAAFSIPAGQYSGTAALAAFLNFRKHGWTMNLMGHAYAIVPDNDPQGNCFRAYADHNMDFYGLTVLYMPASQLVSGAGSVGGTISPWMENICCQGAYMAYQCSKNTNARTMGDFFVQNAIGQAITHIYRSTTYRASSTPKSTVWEPTTNEFFPIGEMPRNQFKASINITTNFLTRTALTTMPIKNGDKLYPCTMADAHEATIPVELADGELLYMVNVSGETFQVSRTLGGAAIDFTTAYTGGDSSSPTSAQFNVYFGSDDDYVVSGYPPDACPADGYSYICSAALNMAAFNGVTAAQALLGKMETFLSSVDTSSWVSWRLRA